MIIWNLHHQQLWGKILIITFNRITTSILGLNCSVEATPAPLVMRPNYNSERIFSSFDDNNNYFNSLNVFRQLVVKGRNNIITVGDCGKSTVDFVHFLSCLGLTVQETTTLTATFTQTLTLSSGFTTFTVNGCTPFGFPYIFCPPTNILSTTYPSSSFTYNRNITQTTYDFGDPTEPIPSSFEISDII